MTLSEFLLARIAEDEEIAWTRGEYEDPSGADERFTHARQTAECEAKRRIVEIAVGDWDPELVERNVREHRGPSLVHREDEEDEWVDEWTTSRLLRALALPFVDHPDYDEAWRP